jgi:hypothetical protein
VVARLGGDEFAVLLDRVRSPAEAVLVAERITTAMQPPFALGGRAMHVGASVGVACGRDGESIDELLRNADLAMYRAKAAGKNRHALFAPEMHAALLDRVELEDELRHGLERDEFSLVYQPSSSCPTGAWSASRRSCAGSTRVAVRCLRRCSSPWPRSPAPSRRWAGGCSPRPAARPRAGARSSARASRPASA